MTFKYGSLACVLLTASTTYAATTFSFTNQWSGGGQGLFHITNDTNQPIQGWTLQFDWNAEITSAWNGTVQSHVGNHYKIINADYNATIAPGASVDVGCVANFAVAGLLPTSMTIMPVAQCPADVNMDSKVDSGDVGTILGNWGSTSPIYDLNADGITDSADLAVVLGAWGPCATGGGGTGGGGTGGGGGDNGAVAPVITSPATAYGTVGSVFTYQITASGLPTSFGATGLPAGLSVNTTSGLISGTPTLAAATSVALAASNAVGIATQSLVVTISPASAPGDFNYAEVLQKSLYFYDAQRSGNVADGFRVPWRGDSALTDGSDVVIDLTGGYYDAGDHLKFGLPMASSLSLLAWGGIEYGAAYEKTGQKLALLAAVRWGTDFIIKAHPSANVLYGQVGNGSLDHSYWGPSETMNMARPSYAITAAKPGSDLAGESAAAMAAASMLFRSTDPAYADTLLAHARTLFNFADTYRGKYSDSITDAATYYNSWSGYYDELAWSAAWLYRATGEAAYLAKAEAIYSQNIAGLPLKWTHNWDDKTYGVTVLLAQLTGNSSYKAAAQRWLDFWTVGDNGSRIAYTAGGLAWLDQWGSLRYAANTSFLALIYADRVGDVGTRYRDFARNQIDYMLGKNPNARSYVVGFGVNPPMNPHHRGAHGSWNGSMTTPAASRHILYGALVGGPSTTSDGSYSDDRSNYICNEVALDYNAGFTGAVARLAQDSTGVPVANFPPVSEQGSIDDEFFVEASINQQGSGFTEIRALLNNRSAFPAVGSSALTMRYFVDLSELFAAGYDQTSVVVSGNYIQNGTVAPALKVYDAARKLYYVDVSFVGTYIAPGTGSSYWREAQFRMSLKTGVPATAWNAANDPSFTGLGAGNASMIKTSKIAVYDNGFRLTGVLP
ncbi:MAG: glycoside hydrolase family 9 protein [Planctomycetota bacterium]